jgi:Cytochrome P460
MLKISQNRIRTLLVPGAFFYVALIAISIPLMAEEIFLTPPGMRLVKDPTLVIPAGYRYSNNLIELPAYRSASGNPANGWSGKFVGTRRFVSNQSAWIYFRDTDLARSVTPESGDAGRPFRIWPVGTTLVIESYRGNALHKKSDALIEIAVMSKLKDDSDSSTQVFYPVKWTYARFNPDGKSSITSAKVRECHQCHSIAFHFTGDLIFSKFH